MNATSITASLLTPVQPAPIGVYVPVELVLTATAPSGANTMPALSIFCQADIGLQSVTVRPDANGHTFQTDEIPLDADKKVRIACPMMVNVMGAATIDYVFEITGVDGPIAIDYTASVIHGYIDSVADFSVVDKTDLSGFVMTDESVFSLVTGSGKEIADYQTGNSIKVTDTATGQVIYNNTTYAPTNTTQSFEVATSNDSIFLIEWVLNGNGTSTKRSKASHYWHVCRWDCAIKKAAIRGISQGCDGCKVSCVPGFALQSETYERLKFLKQEAQGVSKGLIQIDNARMWAKSEGCNC